MKFFIWLLVVAAIVVGAYVIFHNPDTGQTSTTTTSSSPDSGDADQYQLFVMADGVTIQHTGDTAPNTVTDTASVKQGDHIVTSATGRARLSYPDGTITTLEPGTDITVSELSNEGRNSRITLNLGDIWSKVTRILGSGDHYEVQTKETVAAVRGTIFRTMFRNQHAKIQGIEHSVRVFVRNEDGTTDDASGTDVTEETQVDIDPTIVAMPKGKRLFAARKLTRDELNDPIFARIKRERDLDNNHIDRPGLRLKETVTPTPKTTKTPVVSVQVRVSPVVIPSIPTLPPGDGMMPISSILPYISNLPSTGVKLLYVSPKTTKVGASFSVNGSGFMTGSTRNVTGVLVGYTPAEFHIIDPSTIFVTAPQLSPGVYEITVSTTESIVNLKPGITIQ